MEIMIKEKNMSPNVDLYRLQIKSDSCDFRGRASLPAIGNYILDAAGDHSDKRGFGYLQVRRQNVAWVLSRLSIEMYEYPSYGQELVIQTWIESVETYFTVRCFRLADKDDNLMGYARSIWVVIDMKTRRPMNIPAWRPDLLGYVTNEIECPIGKYDIILPVNETERVAKHRVRFSDIDINYHMNSIKYIESMIDTFDMSFFKEKMIHKFSIVYLTESFMGDKLVLYGQNVPGSEEYLIDIKKETTSICRGKVIWIPQNPTSEETEESDQNN
jgi:acyl-ACP thioesterase